jgi:hypothetical protein
VALFRVAGFQCQFAPCTIHVKRSKTRGKIFVFFFGGRPRGKISGSVFPLISANTA